ncbi:hypothetical protein [Nocardia xishanensis]|uniref:hypothetical protein n=1 Tax=Nocardia xishanensis TaxID=238964 RepID=UPI003433BDDB
MPAGSHTSGRFSSLTDDELTRLARLIPNLSAAWAHSAATTVDLLQGGKSKALRALRATAARNPQSVNLAFAELGMAYLVHLRGKSIAGGEELKHLAAREFGADAAAVFLQLVDRSHIHAYAADSRTTGGAATDASEHLELDGRQTSERSHDLKDASMREPDNDDLHTDSTSAQELLSTIRELTAHATTLAAALRRSADAMEAGHPRNVELDAAVQWRNSAIEHLDRAGQLADEIGTGDFEPRSLRDAERQLVGFLDNVDEQQRTRAAAAKALAAFRQQGLDHLIPKMLESIGFRSEAELSSSSERESAVAHIEHDVVTAPDSPAGTEDRRNEVESVPAPSAEPAESSSPAFAREQDPPTTDSVVPEVGDCSLGVVDEFDDDTWDTDISEHITTQTHARTVTSSATRTEASQPVLQRTPESDAINYPWDAGAPPLIARLLTKGDDPLAIHLAVAANETPLRQQILKLFCASFSCSPSHLAQELARVPSDAEVSDLQPDEARTLLVAVLRAGLSLGYFPLLVPALVERSALEPALRHVFEVAHEAVVRGSRWGTGYSTDPTLGLSHQWEAFGEQASALLATLSKRKIKFELATKVLHHLVKPGQPIGAALLAVQQLSEAGTDVANSTDDSWRELDDLAAVLQDGTQLDKLIDHTTKDLAGTRRRQIIAGARRTLENDIGEVGELLLRFIELRNTVRGGASHGSEASEQLAAAVEHCELARAPHSVGDAAVARFLAWLKDPGTFQPRGASLVGILRESLDPLFEIERDEVGHPDRPPTLAEVGILLAGRADSDIVAGFLERGNIAAARSYVETNGDDDPEATEDAIRRAEQHAKQHHTDAMESVKWLAARLRALNEDDLARELISEAQAASTPEPERYDLAHRELRRLAHRGQTHLDTYRADLRSRVETLDAAREDKDRIIDLLAEQDEILAVDFLTRLQAGLSLPKVDYEGGDDFADFFPAMVEVAVSAQAEKHHPIEAVRAALQAPRKIENRQLREGFQAWEELRKSRKGPSTSTFRLAVAHVLRMIGLVPPSQDWLRDQSNSQRSGFAAFRAKAHPVDRSYVPELGTHSHGNYDLILVWDNVSASRLMEFIPETRRTQPNIILYFRVLDVSQRRALRSLAAPGRGRGVSPIVVDDAVIAWLSTRREPGWRFTQRVTLPFTTFNPYTPFAGGEVPDEVFVGRELERAAIESPTGPMFVYGGRQLGKSALLRRVERMFTDPISADEPGSGGRRTGRVAVYIDLKAAAIGEMLEPTKLWGELAERLKAAGVITVGRTRESTVSTHIQEWLAEDASNRLLLLLDEADNFLTADARNTGKSGEFPTLQGLKKLMEASNRRLKPVFAGLHQVQRFQDLPNTPIGHGGQEILIGPLRSRDAFNLVVDPMRALGYAFRSPDVVWRLLLYTNYQASLVQILCASLVRRMQNQPLPPDGGRIEITSQHVDSVYAERDVRDLIVQRFRWTINLDARYRIIALVVALNTLDAQPGAIFTVDELREQCEVFWETGFAKAVLPEARFVSYLEEMVGLGVLHRRDDSYGLRSPHIIGLLGSSEALNRELAEAPATLELPHEYNPTMNRRVLGGATQISSARSSLTDSDLAILLKRDRGTPTRIVTGSQALGLQRVAQALTDAATEQNLTFSVPRPEEWPKTAAGFSELKGHLLLDLSQYTRSYDLGLLTRQLNSRGASTAVVITGPAYLPLPANMRKVAIVQLRRWSMEELRFWHESPFQSPELRTQLHYVTSGWPELVEEAMERVNKGRHERALELVAQSVQDPLRARSLLDSCGVNLSVATEWARSASTTGRYGLLDPIPVDRRDLLEILAREPEPVLSDLEALDLVTETADGWILDRVVLSAAKTLID